MDRSIKLLEIARTAGSNGCIREVVQGNVAHNPWRTGAFDYAISIATIHHLATPERRKLAVQRLIQAISPNHGRALIYVWAIEQDELSKRTIPVEGEAKTGRDVVVPWVLSKTHSGEGSPKAEQVYNRYYHMFAKGELRELVIAAASDMGLEIGPKPTSQGGRVEGVEIVQDGWERSNYYVELHRWTS
ncbi:hypothetical protein CC1G_03924 [Coprinopsis cinerea okayama7|uniref:Methyltransferase type 11 domain-containing protein n=1 Tax=Coprinopsis cinerea (strain Okayama-7 / 130 / ATCC MYA-4618 / FGSC 9003) TaxID=240176 RepID=A8NH81_COPC7|nr:hypothetical protein CC1G_03924 [Coprinopsis cinerea okayama7\|eukprot:XP_001833707.2 hypothetical protein CC1G_03924 [Coprinopsis cinerea okayama7\